MILQRNQPVPVWGKADAGEKITVTIQDQTQRAITDNEGNWKVILKQLKSGGSYQLQVSGGNGETIRCRNVKVGDVWLCAGQSNMNFMLAADRNGAAEISTVDNDNILEFRTAMPAGVFNPENKYHSQWISAKGEAAATFSAVAYYFAKRLQTKQNIPVGIIVMACGNTRAEAWTNMGFLKSYAELKPLLRYWEGKKRDTNVTVTHIPGNFYNDVVVPILPFAVKGIIWYQGESNALPDNPGRTITECVAEYKTLLQALILNWRKAWDNPAMPFYIVQLPNYSDSSGNLHWATIRQAQLEIAKEVPHVGMAVTIDIGDSTNIHPNNKQAVGERLARWALEKEYHSKTDIVSGPVIRNMKVKGSNAILYFDYTGTGLVSKDRNALRGFEIADATNPNVFTAANATIKGRHVVVAARGIQHPVSVRYAWADNPKASLYNREGLPASPFFIKKK